MTSYVIAVVNGSAEVALARKWGNPIAVVGKRG